jgi:hypothetical protein
MDLSSQAIQASLNRNWREAIKLNTELLKSQPGNIDALNRLAKAELQSGLKTKAELTYKKVLKLDKYNSIATKGLDTIKNFRVVRNGQNPHPPSDFSQAFLEEPGTTKTVSLIRLGDNNVLARLQPGDEVNLAAREHCVSVINSQQEYLGRLPDDLASRLGSFLKAGNVYQAWVKSVTLHDKSQDKHTLKIFIKEVKRVSKYKNIPSFPSTEKLSYAAFTPPELIYFEKPNTATTEEDVEDVPANPEDRLDSDSDGDSDPND